MLLFYLVFYIIPIFIALDGSFHIWNPLNGKYVFNGLKNYQRLMKNDLFWTAGLNTVIFCFGVTVGRAALGFACAYAMSICIRKLPLETAVAEFFARRNCLRTSGQASRKTSIVF